MKSHNVKFVVSFIFFNRATSCSIFSLGVKFYLRGNDSNLVIKECVEMKKKRIRAKDIQQIYLKDAKIRGDIYFLHYSET